MSPRRTNPKVRFELIDIAARLLAENGPGGLSTRRVAAAAGCSTMAVYTHFGSMTGLVREIVHEGFGRLQQCFSRVVFSADPVADMALLGRAYRHNAVTNPNLYAVMFGGVSLAGFSLTEQDRRHGRYTLVTVTECASRCIAAGRFRSTDPELVARQMWMAIHGLTTLELGGYLTDPWQADRCFEPQITGLMIAMGDTPPAATRSVEISLARFRPEVVAA
ncbi:MAG TPA: TetR/AcrR family transcriptional regulator [Kutzneria sp.]|nr:TetR/AcrR family transcriptional regulator [Kutzneria sp.]